MVDGSGVFVDSVVGLLKSLRQNNPPILGSFESVNASMKVFRWKLGTTFLFVLCNSSERVESTKLSLTT